MQHLGTGTTARGDAIAEHPGLGVEGQFAGKRARLGRLDWVAAIAGSTPADDLEANLAFAIEGGALCSVALGETPRAGARQTIAELQEDGLGRQMLSGDAHWQVAHIAARLGIDDWRAGQSPADKIAHVEALRDNGAKVLFVGDGINDAPALAAGHVSMAPSSGSDVGRTAADFVFTRDSLAAVTAARGIALRAQRLVKQNFALAFAYNVIAVPIAMAGLVTPLVAAIAMSASSIVVVLNSMRLTRGAAGRTRAIGNRHTGFTTSASRLEAAE